MAAVGAGSDASAMALLVEAAARGAAAGSRQCVAAAVAAAIRTAVQVIPSELEVRDSLVDVIMAHARAAHEALAARLAGSPAEGGTPHSLASAARRCRAQGLLSVPLERRLLRLSAAADAVRHATPTGLAAVYADLLYEPAAEADARRDPARDEPPGGAAPGGPARRRRPPRPRRGRPPSQRRARPRRPEARRRC